jgi:hypothetical protein
MNGALKIVVSCDILGLEESCQGICFWACIFQGLSICYNEFFLVKTWHIILLNYTKRSIKVYNLAQNFKKRSTIVEQDTFWI